MDAHEVLQGGLRLDVSRSSHGPRYKLAGEIDIGNVGSLLARLRLLMYGLDERVDLDLGEVAFMDSSSLTGLLVLNNDLAAVGQRLRIVAMSPQVERLFEVTGVAPLLELASGAPEGG